MSLFLVLVPGRGSAQDRKDEKPAATERLKKLNGAARKQWAAHLTAQAERRYLERDYEAALQSYQEAYLTVPAPELLFNLGQCHRQLHHPREALFFFRVYLRERPRVGHRATVESLMLEARRELARTTPRQTDTDERARTAALSRSAERGPQNDERRLSRRARRWAWAVAGAFVVAGTSAALATTLRKDDRGSATTTRASLSVVDWR